MDAVGYLNKASGISATTNVLPPIKIKSPGLAADIAALQAIATELYAFPESPSPLAADSNSSLGSARGTLAAQK